MTAEPGAGDSHSKLFSLTKSSLALSALAFLGALAGFGYLPSELSRVAGAVLFFVSAALPILARIGPPKPSLFKLLTVSALLSPVFSTVVYWLVNVMLGRAIGPGDVVAGTFIALGLLQLLGIGRVVQHERLGRTAWFVIGLSAVAGAVVLLLLFRGSAMRASYHGLLHSALVLAVDRAVPPAHPWMAGEELGYYWFWHAMGALFSRALSVAPTFGLALTNLWAAVVLPIALYLTAAPCFRNGRREWIGVLFALFGLNAFGAWVWLLTSREWSAPEAPALLIESLSVTVGDWDRRLAFGFSKFGNLSSYPTALALFAGALMCGVHAIRSGAKPWVSTCAALNGAALLVNPIVGGLGIASTMIAACCFAKEARRSLLVWLIVWSIPGTVAVSGARDNYAGETLQFVWREGVLWATLAPVVLLLIPALFLRGLTKSSEPEVAVGQRRALGLLFTAALLPLAMHLAIALPYDNQYKFLRIAALPLGLLAAGGLGVLIERGGVVRLLGIVFGLALFVGVLVSNGLGFASYYSLSGKDLPLSEEPLALFPIAEEDVGGTAAELASLYRWLAEFREVRTIHPVLIVNTTADSAPLYGTPASHAFTDPLRNLQGHEAAPFTGLPLWCDRPSQVLSAETPGWEERIRVVWQLYRESGALDDAEARLLFSGGGSERLLLVSSDDRRVKPGIDTAVEALGFQEVRRVGGSSVYAWPEQFARDAKERKP